METSIEKEKQRVLKRIKESKTLYELLESGPFTPEEEIGDLIHDTDEYNSVLLDILKGTQVEEASIYKKMMNKTKVVNITENGVEDEYPNEYTEYDNPNEYTEYDNPIAQMLFGAAKESVVDASEVRPPSPAKKKVEDDTEYDIDQVVNIPAYYTDHDVFLEALKSKVMTSLEIKHLFKCLEVEQIVRDKEGNRYFIVQAHEEDQIFVETIEHDIDHFKYTKKALETLDFLQSNLDFSHREFTAINVGWNITDNSVVIKPVLGSQWSLPNSNHTGWKTSDSYYWLDDTGHKTSKSYDAATLVLSMVDIKTTKFKPLWLERLAMFVTREYLREAEEILSPEDYMEWKEGYMYIDDDWGYDGPRELDYLPLDALRDGPEPLLVESCTPSKLLGMLKNYMDSRKRKSAEEQKESQKRQKLGPSLKL